MIHLQLRLKPESAAAADSDSEPESKKMASSSSSSHRDGHGFDGSESCDCHHIGAGSQDENVENIGLQWVLGYILRRKPPLLTGHPLASPLALSD